MNLTRKFFKITSSGKKPKLVNGSGSCPNVTFEDNEDNKALNDQGKDEGTLIVTAQFKLNMSWSLT
jgi:hypothetical protein